MYSWVIPTNQPTNQPTSHFPPVGFPSSPSHLPEQGRVSRFFHPSNTLQSPLAAVCVGIFRTLVYNPKPDLTQSDLIGEKPMARNQLFFPTSYLFSLCYIHSSASARKQVRRYTHEKTRMEPVKTALGPATAAGSGSG
jgi:hypothetical protein